MNCAPEAKGRSMFFVNYLMFIVNFYLTNDNYRSIMALLANITIERRNKI